MTQGRLAVLCELSGRVLEVIRDDLDIIGQPDEATMLPSLGTVDGSLRCFEMFSALREETAIFGWLIELRTPSGPAGLHFAGVHRDGQILLVASEELSDVSSFTDELARVNSEHVSQLRELVKERATLIPTQVVYPQMTELNNANTALEREILGQKTELEALLRAKDELLGMAAHDLRNPLTAISGHLELLGLDETLSAPQREIVDEVEAAVSMMIRILDGVLDVSAIESGRLELDLRVCDLEAIASRATALHLLGARRAGVNIVLRTSGALQVSADEAKLHQVINNLLANAIAHSPRESSVYVEIERRGDDACLSIRDEGLGVPENERSLVFQAFHRGSASEPGGSGLGLAIARRIAQGHGGTLELIPSDGKGAHLELRLPLTPVGEA